jgi:DNA invertase Pin-like site-specific DNA recombinase
MVEKLVPEDVGSAETALRKALAGRYNTVRPFLTLLGESPALAAAQGGKRILAAVRKLPALAARKPSRRPLLPRDIDGDLVPRAWRPAVFANSALPEGRVDRDAYVVCVLELLHRALTRRDVFAAPSNRWSDPRARLLDGPRWDAVRDDVLAGLSLDMPVTEHLRELTQGLGTDPERARVLRSLAYQFRYAALTPEEANKKKISDQDTMHPANQLSRLSGTALTQLARWSGPVTLLVNAMDHAAAIAASRDGEVGGHGLIRVRVVADRANPAEGGPLQRGRLGAGPRDDLADPKRTTAAPGTEAGLSPYEPMVIEGDLLDPVGTANAALVGYARVSTRDQNLDRQVDALTTAGCIRVFREKLSGRNAERPELWKCLDYLRTGDTLAVLELSRLGRNMQDLLSLVGGLSKRGIGFRSLHESLDTTTPGEFIRELIVEGTNEGLAAARARGQRLGRPPALTPEQVLHIRGLLANPEASVASIARLIGVNRSTIYKYVPELAHGREALIAAYAEPAELTTAALSTTTGDSR